MLETITSAIIAVAVSIGGLFGIQEATPQPQTLGAFGHPFVSLQLAPDPDNGECLTTDGTENIWSTSCGSGSGSAYPFTPLTNFGVTNSATGTPLWAQAGINASSTSHFVNASTTNLSSTGEAKFTGSFLADGSSHSFGGNISLWNSSSFEGYSDAGSTFLGGFNWSGVGVLQLDHATDSLYLDYSRSTGKTATFSDLSGTIALGSYYTGFTGGSIPFGSSGLLATSSSLTFDGTKFITPYASTTALTVSDTAYIGSGGAGDSVAQFGPTSNEWSLGYDDTNKNFVISSSTSLGTNNALSITKNGLLTFTYGSTTALSATSLCLSTDCRTTWPSGSGSDSGKWSTTTNTVAIYPNGGSTVGVVIGGTATTTNSNLQVIGTTTSSSLAVGSTAIASNVFKVSPLTGLTTSNSESVGGIINGNFGTTDALGMVLYNNNTGSQRLLSLVCDAATFGGNCLHVRNDGTETALNILGNPEGKGIIKIGTQGVGDADASAISIDTSLASNIGQGIFIKGNASGKLLNIRGSDNSEWLTLLPTGFMGLGTSSPYTRLGVAGTVVADNFVATSTTQASSFQQASTTMLTVSGTSYFGGDLDVSGVGLVFADTDTSIYSEGSSQFDFYGTHSTAGQHASLNLSNITTDRVYTFPDWSGDIVISTSTTQVSSINATSTNTNTFVGNISFYGELLPDGATCSDGQILKKTGANDWDCAADATGAGSGAGTFSTTTSTVSGQLINYPNNDTDIVSIGSNSTTTAEFYFDPNRGNAFFNSTTGTTTIVNALQLGSTAGDSKLKIVADRIYPASNSVGGMVNLSNTSNTGPALVIYTNNGGTSSGNLVNVRCDNTAMAHDCVKIDHDGAGDGLAIAATAAASNALSLSNTGVDHTLNSTYTGSTANKGALNISSTNTTGSVFQVSGVSAGLGIGKLTHTGVGDADSSILSLSATDSGYLGQGVFADISMAALTQKLLNLRANSSEVLTLLGNGNMGLGSSSPYTKLGVSGEIVADYFTGTTTATSTLSGNFMVKSDADSLVPTIEIRDLDISKGNGDYIGNLDFHGSDASGVGAGIKARISAVSADSSGSTNAITFGLRAAGGTVTERYRFGTDGLNPIFGLGSTTPSSVLSVRVPNSWSQSNYVAYIMNEDTFPTTAGNTLMIQGGAGSDDSAVLDVRGTSNTNFLSIRGLTGNVGIGTTSPLTNLQVNRTAATSTISATVINGTTRSTTKGGSIILQDAVGGTCTEITTQSGVMNSKAVACP